MIVTAALPWWNERPEDLYECVVATGNIADRIIALDGAYVRYPEATVQSSSDQHDAIRSGASKAGLECTIVQIDRLWAGQVEKRAYLLGMAGVGSNWIVTVDADHIIKTDRDSIRAALKREQSDVIEVPYHTPVNPDKKMSEAAVGKWHVLQTKQVQFIPHIWRALPGLTVERFHWWYKAINREGHKVWLWGGDGTKPTVRHAWFRKNYEVEHRSLFRTEEQIRLSRAFLNDRQLVVEKTGQEDHRSDLPEPDFDYGMVPW